MKNGTEKMVQVNCSYHQLQFNLYILIYLNFYINLVVVKREILIRLELDRNFHNIIIKGITKLFFKITCKIDKLIYKMSQF